jgi:GNAT superfamily N-acetyltransferase
MAFAIFGVEPPTADEVNHVAAVKKARAWLEAGDEAGTVCFVIDAPDGDGLAASAIGAVDERLPSERNPSGVSGYVYGVCTDERYRRRGYSRLVMRALLDWYIAQGIPRVELHASEYGDALYRELGFTEPFGAALTWWAP